MEHNHLTRSLAGRKGLAVHQMNVIGWRWCSFSNSQGYGSGKSTKRQAHQHGWNAFERTHRNFLLKIIGQPGADDLVGHELNAVYLPNQRQINHGVGL